MTTPPTDELRAWARENGFVVADRGRLSGEILTAWQNSQKSTAPKSAKSTTTASSTNGQSKPAAVTVDQTSRTAATDRDKDVILDLRDEVVTLRNRVEALESRLTEPPRRRFLRSRA